jgi:rhodanese-related sulfurtransferase
VLNRAGHLIRAVLPEVVVLLLVSILLGGAANLVSPRRIPWVEDWTHYIEAKALKAGVTLVTAKQVEDMIHGGTYVVFDARPEADYQAGHLPGAVSLPYQFVEEALAGAQALLTPAQPIVAYCSGEDCDESFLLTLYLRKQGFTNVVLFAGGFDQWKAGGHPVEDGR